MIAFTKGPFWGARCGNSARRVLIGEPGTSRSGGKASGIYQPTTATIMYFVYFGLEVARRAPTRGVRGDCQPQFLDNEFIRTPFTVRQFAG